MLLLFFVHQCNAYLKLQKKIKNAISMRLKEIIQTVHVKRLLLIDDYLTFYLNKQKLCRFMHFQQNQI